MKLEISVPEQNYQAERLLLDSASQMSEVAQTKIGNTTLWDFGVEQTGSVESGQLLAMVSSADGLEVSVGQRKTVIPTACAMIAEGVLQNYFQDLEATLPETQTVCVNTESCSTTCLGSQYAGWPCSFDNFFAMASGPGRLCRGKEKVFEHFQLVGQSDVAVVVLETSTIPTNEVITQIRKELGWDSAGSQRLHLCLASSSSLPGRIQIVARSLETAVHQFENQQGDLSSLGSGIGIAPLPPEPTNDLQAIGWTNDAIIYGGLVAISTSTNSNTVGQLKTISSRQSPSYGKSFLELFEEAGRDFYEMDPALFAPSTICHYGKMPAQDLTGGWNMNLLKNCWSG